MSIRNYECGYEKLKNKRRIENLTASKIYHINKFFIGSKSNLNNRRKG